MNTDSERLDFLQRHKIDLIYANGHWTCYGLGVCGRPEFASVREAIDDAMEEVADNEQWCAAIELMNAAKQAADWIDAQTGGPGCTPGAISGILRHAIMRAEGTKLFSAGKAAGVRGRASDPKHAQLHEPQ